MNLITTIANQLSDIYSGGEARALARCVVEDKFHLSPTDIILGKDNDLPAEDKAELQNIILRLRRGEPVQYVLGFTLFCGHRFNVSPACLIPRPETEDLVSFVVSDCKSEAETHILDIGTGSGCIAVSLSLAREANLSVTAWDVSEDALSVAATNNKELGGNVVFEKKDILHVGEEERTWDVIVSNPPYVCRSEAAQMERNVVEHEPHLALFVSDEEPLVFYRSIGEFAFSRLKEGGSLYVEINHRFPEECMNLLAETGLADRELREDRFGKARMIKCKKR